MQIQVTGHHMQVGQSLRNHVQERTELTVHKYFEKINESKITFTKKANDFICVITLHDDMGRHITIKGEGTSLDAYSAFDAAIHRIEKQLRKYKGKIKNHHYKKLSDMQPNSNMTSVDYILHHGEYNPDTGEFEEFDQPNIIDEKVTQILTLDINDAIMKLELEDLTTLVFINVKNNRINVVYRDHNSGKLCLVDPKTS